MQTGPGALYLSLADWPPLQAQGGSVQIHLSPDAPDLVINRGAGGQFFAMDSTCTHAGCQVGKFMAASNYIECPCHGSRYDIQGRVVRGPADEDLASFPAVFDGADELKVNLAFLPADVRAIRLWQKSASSIRVKLSFPVTGSERYQVRRHTSPSGPFVVVPFSTLPSGLATQTLLEASGTGIRTVYVDSAGGRGFFVVVTLPP